MSSSATNAVANAKNKDAYERGFVQGAKEARQGWSNWFETLPYDVQVILVAVKASPESVDFWTNDMGVKYVGVHPRDLLK